MKRINELKAILKEKFDWNKSRLDGMAKMRLSLLIVQKAIYESWQQSLEIKVKWIRAAAWL